MKYYTFLEKTEMNSDVNNNNYTKTFITYSEDEVIQYFWPIWSQRITERYGSEYFKSICSRENCIKDFVNFTKATENSALTLCRSMQIT